VTGSLNSVGRTLIAQERDGRADLVLHKWNLSRLADRRALLASLGRARRAVANRT